MIWSHVAHLYMESFQRARRSRLDVPYKPLAVRTLAEQPMDLPGWRLDHLVRMTDSAGHPPARQLDDPQLRRGLLHRRQRPGAAADRAAGAARPELGAGPPAGDDLRRVPEFRVRPGPGPVPQLPGLRPPLARGGRLRRLPRPGAAGCWGPASAGRSVATCNSGPRSSSTWRCRRSSRRPRPAAWAFGLIGVCLYLQRFGGARPASQVRDTLTERLIELFDKTATDDWPWFEEVLSYDNAKLPHALIASGRSGGNPRALDVGLQALRWLVEQQKSPTGLLPPDRRPTASTAAAASGPSSTSSRSRPTPRSRPASRPTTPPTTPPGSRRPGWRSSGSWAATTWGWTSTTPRPAAAATACRRTAST